MNLDVQKVISTTQANKTRGVALLRMTYEDLAGKLNTSNTRLWVLTALTGS